jgi:hypothetical protein
MTLALFPIVQHLAGNIPHDLDLIVTMSPSLIVVVILVHVLATFLAEAVLDICPAKRALLPSTLAAHM